MKQPQIQITAEQWQKLNQAKTQGQTFSDVLDGLLETKENGNVGNLETE